MLDGIAVGLLNAITLEHLLACLVGTALGTAVGVLPGLGPVAALALLLPFTFGLEPTAALIALAGIYYGAQYGGSISAILINLPGEAASAVTCRDGYAMARSGRAALALSTAAVASFVGGTVATALIAVAAAPMAFVSARLEAANFAALMVFGLVAAAIAERGKVAGALALSVVGLLLGAIGTDPGGAARWTLGIPELFDGIGFLPVAIGLFGFSEIIAVLANRVQTAVDHPKLTGLNLLPGELCRGAAAATRGTTVGALLGMLPGGGPTIASFAAYGLEQLVSKRHDRFGQGAIEGIAGPEAANNAAAQTSFVPLLMLGLPSNPAVALLLSAMIVQGVQPGPSLLSGNATLFWTLIASMWVGNGMLLLLNLPIAHLWARLLRIPVDVLYPATIALSCAGIYAVSRSELDLGIAALFGIVGYLLRRCGLTAAPLLVGFVLSRPLEENVRRALVFSDGAMTIFATHPVSAAILVATIVLLVTAFLGRPRRQTERERTAE